MKESKLNPYNTDEEAFWAGEFGDEYIIRNNGSEMLASNLSFFSKATRLVHKPSNAIEFGANIGMNLKALKLLYPKLTNYGIEINRTAILQLRNLLEDKYIYNTSVLEFNSDMAWDLVFTKGLLIHINPNKLGFLYEKLVKATKKYLLIAEYYHPHPVSISYRGHNDKLYKRDFAGEILDKYKELELVDYGFAYKRDRNFPQDDINWFLLEKKNHK